MTPVECFDDVSLSNEEIPRRAAPQGITTMLELQSLDEELLRKGYLAGLKNAADFSMRDPAYWHGYFNGMVDGKHMQGTPEQYRFAREYVDSGTLRSDVQRWQSAAARLSA